MKKILSLVLILVTLCKTQQGKETEIDEKVTFLNQDTFIDGSFIITKPGKYVFSEDIVFDPPLRVPLKLLKINTVFHIGFFAAIVVQADNVTIDLNGFEIKQSIKHNLHQRFYSHIELGNSPFLANVGPHTFTTLFIPVSNIIITNGSLGLSAHHGIHGNNPKNVKISNLKIYDWEVAAIAINGGINMNIKNILAGPSNHNVPILGGFSAAKFIKGFVESLVFGGQICDALIPPFIVINGVQKTAKKILEDLVKTIEDTEKAVLSGKFEDIPKLYRNKHKLPDGSTIYGLLFNQNGGAVGPFNTTFENNLTGTKVKLKNITIRGMSMRMKEKIGLQIEGETNTTNFSRVQFDARGASFDVIAYTAPSGSYKSEPLGDAQLIVAKYKKCLADNAAKFKELNLFSTDTSRSSISESTLDWASKVDGTLQRKYVCNTDQQKHSAKGSIPLRLSAVSFYEIENLRIENIKNLTPFGSRVCGNYRHRTSHRNSVPGFTGGDIRAISIESSNEIRFSNVDIEDIESLHGNVFGVDVLFKSKAIKGDLCISHLKTIDWKDLPKDFFTIPQSIPFSIPVQNHEDSSSFFHINIKNFKKIEIDVPKISHKKYKSQVFSKKSQSNKIGSINDKKEIIKDKIEKLKKEIKNEKLDKLRLEKKKDKLEKQIIEKKKDKIDKLKKEIKDPKLDKSKLEKKKDKIEKLKKEIKDPKLDKSKLEKKKDKIDKLKKEIKDPKLDKSKLEKKKDKIDKLKKEIKAAKINSKLEKKKDNIEKLKKEIKGAKIDKSKLEKKKDKIEKKDRILNITKPEKTHFHDHEKNTKKDSNTEHESVSEISNFFKSGLDQSFFKE